VKRQRAWDWLGITIALLLFIPIAALSGIWALWDLVTTPRRK
jgi:hypothetical protein